MRKEDVQAKIARLWTHEASGLYDWDFLLTWRVSPAAVETLLLTAEILEDLVRGGISPRIFEGGLGVSIFRDKSTRTRYAFRSACNLLGLATEELDESTSQRAHGESVRETAAMISFHSEVLGIRDDLYLGEGHRYMAEVAGSVQESYEHGMLPQRPAVLNLQCDLDHPTQTLADLRHLVATFGSLEALRGKKLAMTWAHSPSYGKPLSVPQGIVALMTRFGMRVVLAHPPGYELLEEPMRAARNFSVQSGGSFEVVGSMDEAFQDADVVYPKSWAPVSLLRRRTELLRAKTPGGLDELEKECLAHNAKFQEWEADADRMRRTRAGQALYMHCLPADISGLSCERGEVAADVFERFRLATYKEASYKPYVIAAMIIAARFRDPAAALEWALRAGVPRRRE